MAYNSSSNPKVHTCSTECEQSYAKLKKLYDEQREQLSDASVEIKAYDQGLKKVKAQLVTDQHKQLWYEQKIKYIKIDLDDKTDVLIYHKKLLTEVVKEKEELQAKLESFETSSKSLNTLLNSQLSANDKAGFGHNGAKESKVSETITSVSKAETSNSETSNDKVEMPKIETVRMSEPIIEEWESDSKDDEIVVKPKEVTKTVKPSCEKIESINSKKETVRQAENPRKNNKMPRGLVSLNTAKSVRTAQPRTRMNDDMQKPYSYYKAYSSVKRPFNKKTTNYNRYFNKRVNIVKSTRVNTARPNAEVNTVKASASWVLWIRPDLEVRLEDGVSYPKTRVLDMFFGVEDVVVIAAKHVIVAGLCSYRISNGLQHFEVTCLCLNGVDEDLMNLAKVYDLPYDAYYLHLLSLQGVTLLCSVSRFIG
ncbi:hypothetical protein Tco_1394187 [Tanacetum coccineum]